MYSAGSKAAAGVIALLDFRTEYLAHNVNGKHKIKSVPNINVVYNITIAALCSAAR